MDEESEVCGNSKERFLLQSLHHVCRATPSRVWLFVTLWTLGRQAPLSMEFFRQEYWSRLPFSSSPTQGSTLCLLHLLHGQVGSLSLGHLGIQPLGNCLLILSAAPQELCFPSLHSKVTPKFGGLKQQPFYEISWFYGQWLSWVILCSMEDQTGPKRLVLRWSQVGPSTWIYITLFEPVLKGPWDCTCWPPDGDHWKVVSAESSPSPWSARASLRVLSWVVRRLQGNSEQGPRWKVSFTCRSGLADTTSAVGVCSRQAQASLD